MALCVKSVPIRSYSGPYSFRMRENTDKKNSEYGHFSGNGNWHEKTLLLAKGRRASFDFFLKFDKPFRTEYEHSKNVLQPLCANYHGLK